MAVANNEHEGDRVRCDACTETFPGLQPLTSHILSAHFNPASNLKDVKNKGKPICKAVKLPAQLTKILSPSLVSSPLVSSPLVSSPLASPLRRNIFTLSSIGSRDVPKVCYTGISKQGQLTTLKPHESGRKNNELLKTFKTLDVGLTKNSSIKDTKNSVAIYRNLSGTPLANEDGKGFVLSNLEQKKAVKRSRVNEGLEIEDCSKNKNSQTFELIKLDCKPYDSSLPSDSNPNKVGYEPQNQTSQVKNRPEAGVTAISGTNKKCFVDIPQTFEIFSNKSILVATILAIAQHDFFMTNFRDRRFQYMLNILYAKKKRAKYGMEYISKDLDQLLQSANLGNDNSFPLLQTLEILSGHLKCQFFIFKGSLSLNGNKLFLRYPEKYDCSLKPIFLYKPYNDDRIIFIRNIRSYFASNGKTCLICKTNYKTQHSCRALPSCFICHRYLQKPNSYVHTNLIKFFCDSKVKNDFNQKCQLCNLDIHSESCKKEHKKACNSLGYFGYKCDICNKFIYRRGKQTSISIKQSHQCK